METKRKDRENYEERNENECTEAHREINKSWKTEEKPRNMKWELYLQTNTCIILYCERFYILFYILLILPTFCILIILFERVKIIKDE